MCVYAIMQLNADHVLLCSEDLGSSCAETLHIFSMPGHYVHAIIMPAHEVNGAWCFGSMPADARRYRSVGTMMLLSTHAHKLSQYELFHSFAEFSMGGILQGLDKVGDL